MKILIVGSGGREHAIAWKVSHRARRRKRYTARRETRASKSMRNACPSGPWSLRRLAAFAKEKEIDLTVVGMDDPLVGGIVDVFEKEGLRVFGPPEKRG